MAFTYDTTFSSARDKVRLLIGDTRSEVFVFDDAELDQILTLEGSEVFMSAALAFDVMAGDAAKTAVMLQMPGVNLTAGEVPKVLAERAANMRVRAGLAAQVDFASLYSAADSWIDATMGRSDIDLDTPTDTESPN